MTRRKRSVAVSARGASGGMCMRNASTHNILLCDTLPAYMLFPYNPGACSLRTVIRRRRSVAVSARGASGGMCMRNASTPVSYTHLDVYKRQTYYCGTL